MKGAAMSDLQWIETGLVILIVLVGWQLVQLYEMTKLLNAINHHLYDLKTYRRGER
jgi:hypothetical protein